MEQMVKALYEAAVSGSVTNLVDLIEKDALILDRCTTVSSYAETPLHIAAMLGHLDFCSELVTQSPGLTREVDCRRSSALHIASAKGHTQIVTVLVAVSPEMCLSYDGHGHNPIHIAAMKGRVDVLKELVKANPDGVGSRAKTCQGGTTLHLCVQYCQFEALKFLVEVLKDEELLNAKDDNGNSILHLSVGDKQVEIVEYLVSRTSIDVDASNMNGLTASNILALQTKRDSKYIEIAHFLQPTSSSSQRLQQMQSPSHSIIDRVSSSISSGNEGASHSKSGKHQEAWLEKQQNSIMVVASLIATMAFQAGVNPTDAFFKPGSDGFYTFFVISNTVSLLSSLSIILLLISGLPLRRKAFMWTWMAIMWISIAATTCTYYVSLAATSEWIYNSLPFYIGVAAWSDLMALLFLGHTIRFLSHCIRDWPYKCRVSMWIFLILVVWIVPSFYPLIPKFNPYDNAYVFPRIVSGWIILAAFLVVLYAIQIVLFIIRKLIIRFKGIKAHLCSGDHRSNNVV